MFNLKLERYLLGELSPAETKQLERALKQDAALRAELERLRGDTAAYFAKYPNLKSKKPEPWWQRRITRVIGGGLVFATASVAVVLLLQKPQNEPAKIALNGDNTSIKSSHETFPDGNEIRTKGLIPALLLTANNKTLQDGDTVKPGEKIEIAYRASGYRYGAIFSVDRERAVTLHFPEEAVTMAELQKGARVPLKLAFELDDKPGFENFYFVTSHKKFSVAKLKRELAKNGKLKTTNEDIRIVSIRLNKE